MDKKSFWVLAAASLIAFGEATSAQELDAHVPFLNDGEIITNTVSINPKACYVITQNGDTALYGVGSEGRVFIKFDTKARIASVTAKCNITELGGDFVDYRVEGIDCAVHINAAGVDGQMHDLLECIDGTHPDAATSLHVHNGKASVSCSGPYGGALNARDYIGDYCYTLLSGE